jgi:hypothetical protein
MRLAYVRACKLTLSARRQNPRSLQTAARAVARSLYNRPPTLSHWQTVRAGSQPAPTAASRRSNVFDRPRRYVSKHDCDRIPEVCEKTAPARDRPPTLSQTVRGSQPTRDLDGRKSAPSTASARADMCASMIVTGSPRPVGKLPAAAAPARNRPPTLSQTVRRLAQAPPTPGRFAMPVVESRSRCGAPTPISVQRPRGPKSGGPATCLPRRAIALGHSPRPCAGSRKHRRPRFANRDGAPTPLAT